MKSILFIINNLGGGGAEKVLVDILNNFDYSMYSIDLLLLSEEGVYLNKINKNVKINSIVPKNKFKNKYINKIYRSMSYRMYKYFPSISCRLAIRKKYDVEIAFLEGHSTFLLSKSPNKNSKKIAWVHTDITKHKPISQRIEKESYDKVDKVICVSEEAKQKFIEVYPSYKEKVSVIYNIIDKDKILQMSNEYIKYETNKPTILGIGRLINSKRFDLLIKVYKKLLDDGIDCNLIILGEGGERSKLEELVYLLDIKDKVYMPGYIENPYAYIKKSDVLVVTSDIEGFSLVIAEAMTLGKAIISTDCTGPKELLEDNKYGIIIEKNNLQALFVNLKKFLLSDKYRKKYESLSIKRSKIFNKNEVIESIITLIEK